MQKIVVDQSEYNKSVALLRAAFAKEKGKKFVKISKKEYADWLEHQIVLLKFFLQQK